MLATALRPAQRSASGVRRSSSSTAEFYRKFVDKAVKAYSTDKGTVNDFFAKELKENKLVLFMEGSPDAPKSELSMNVIKMLTQVQAVPLQTVDVLRHPALLGYTVANTVSQRAPHLYVNGRYFGDHDVLLAKYKKGGLGGELGVETKKGELPIGSY